MTCNSMGLWLRFIGALHRFVHVVRTGHRTSVAGFADGLTVTYCGTCASEKRVTFLGLRSFPAVRPSVKRGPDGPSRSTS
jgi:hypothetical protein